VTFADGGRVPLPTDQIVSTEKRAGAAQVGFGGMRFDGLEGGHLTFRRVRDLFAEHELSPERGRRMTLKPEMVAAVFMEGRLAWGRPIGEGLTELEPAMSTPSGGLKQAADQPTCLKKTALAPSERNVRAAGSSLLHARKASSPIQCCSS
jgi:hypothetical protein